MAENETSSLPSDSEGKSVPAFDVSRNDAFLVTEFEAREELPSTKIKNVKQYLWNHWQSIFSGITEDGDNHVKGWFDKICEHYNEEGRYYHTPVHLVEMLEYLSSSSPSNDVPSGHLNALHLATFFHDVIYDPKSGTNEKDSADLFLEFATSFDNGKCVHHPFTSKIVGQVKTLILATEKHQTILLPESDDEYCDLPIQQLFLDIDMAVLGKASDDAYLAYAAAIRKEYSFVPHDTYCEKRAQVLETFLKHSRIYLSNAFHQLEASARKNLQMEIELLKKGRIPGEQG